MLAPAAVSRVLVVDDGPATREVVCALLDLEEYGLLEAPDGPAGLALARVERPELVILDLAAPGLDGFRACQALRSDPDLAGTRVIIVSGRNRPEDPEAARSVGADAYLPKPFSSLALLEVVRQLTGG